MTRAARALVPSGGSAPELESFAQVRPFDLIWLLSMSSTIPSAHQVLQRISRELDLQPPPPLKSLAPSASLDLAYAPLATADHPNNTFPPHSVPAPFTSAYNPAFGSMDPNSTALSADFFRDLGLPSATTGAGTFDYWTPASGATGITPPDFSFLGAWVDWNAMGQSVDLAAGDPNTMAANALLDQLAGMY